MRHPVFFDPCRLASLLLPAVLESEALTDSLARWAKVMTTLFALFAEVERDLISERTREGLAPARASVRKLRRSQFQDGALGVAAGERIGNMKRDNEGSKTNLE